MANRPAPPPAPPREFELYDERLPVRRYKLLLQAFLKRRGSGSRQAMAEALGTTRSFVTQITSPAYDLAIPPQHIRTIVALAELQPDEERAFLDAYILAHPDRASEVLGRPPGGTGGRTLVLSVPILASARAQQRMEQMIERFAADLGAAMAETEAENRPGKQAA